MFLMNIAILSILNAGNIYTYDRFSTNSMPWGYPANDPVSIYFNQQMADGLSDNTNAGRLIPHSPNSTYEGTKSNAIGHSREANQGSNLTVLNTVNVVDVGRNYKLVIDTQLLHKHIGLSYGSEFEEVLIPKDQLANCMQEYDVSAFRCKASLNDNEVAFAECSDEDILYRPNLSCIKNELDAAIKNLNSRIKKRINNRISKPEVVKPIVECVSNTRADDRSRTRIKIMSPMDDFNITSSLLSLETFSDISGNTINSNLIPIDSSCEIKNGRPVLSISSRGSSSRQLQISPPNNNVRYNSQYVDRNQRNMTCTYGDIEELKAYCNRQFGLKNTNPTRQQRPSRGNR